MGLGIDRDISDLLNVDDVYHPGHVQWGDRDRQS
jgi:hypothetical protein